MPGTPDPLRVLVLDGRPHTLFTDGTLLPVIRGGGDNEGGKAGEEEEEEETPPPPAGKGKGGEEDLGEAGKRALAEERRARKAAEKQLKDVNTRLSDLEKNQMSEQEKAVAAAKEAGATEALGAANKRVLRAEVVAAAAGKLRNPEDAAALVDLSQFDVSDDGDVDRKAIKSAIDELVKERPYLAPGGKPGALPGGGATPSEGVDMDAWLRQKAGR